MPERERGERLADWLTLTGALALFASLFLTWSHQFSAAFLAAEGTSEKLHGVPHDPTAWQVYSAADVLLALLSVALAGVALAGTRRARVITLAFSLPALAFALHALATPPTNGANIFDPSLGVPSYVPNSPAAGPGETVAILALGIGTMGLLLSLKVAPRRSAPS
ncbi:MAG: hypothetical protein M3Z27_00755 [Actinomycetota bacterium]|nr:hypothetical protein [Actinomycetota bacterium]